MGWKVKRSVANNAMVLSFKKRDESKYTNTQQSAWKIKFVRFATFLSVFFVIASVRGPVTYLIKTFQIPLLDSTTPSRFISLSIFLMIAVAGFGFEDFLHKLFRLRYLKSFIKFCIVVGILYVLMWIFTYVGHLLLKPADTWQINLAVTRRNLIIPSFMFTSFLLMSASIYVLFPKIKIQKETKKNLIIACIFTLTLFGGIYFSNKFLPFAPKKFIFPDHPLPRLARLAGDFAAAAGPAVRDRIRDGLGAGSIRFVPWLSMGHRRSRAGVFPVSWVVRPRAGRLATGRDRHDPVRHAFYCRDGF